jgi:betaine-aldehyde dehydrogenase
MPTDATKSCAGRAPVLPVHDGLYYGGAWHAPMTRRFKETRSPATAERLGQSADGGADDVNAAIEAAQIGFQTWRSTPPLERGRIMRRIAGVIRSHVEELALLDSADGGNPVSAMAADVLAAAEGWEFFAGLVTEMKGDTIPMGPDAVNFTLREPLGVVARIVAFNHPFMFSAFKAAAPLAAGNAVIIKPAEQAPLSTLRLAELLEGLLPLGVFNVLTGGRELGEALTAHSGVAIVTLVGSAATGRAVMKSASSTLKPVLLELGGKNALIAFPDADPDEVANAVVAGMNFSWCGQSCGSTSRAFLHDAIHDAVMERLGARIAAFKPGLPTDPATTMGAIISEAQYDRVLRYIEVAQQDGTRLVIGGRRPDDPALAKGYFIEPTVFADVTQTMRIANEEVFGPILSVLRWNDTATMIDAVNRVEYGLTCAIWTNDLGAAHRTAGEVQAGFVWINEVGKHFLGAPFGGYKQSGIGREECLSELLAFTQEKNIHLRLRKAQV